MKTINRSSVTRVAAVLFLFAGGAVLSNACSSDDTPGAGAGGSGGSGILGDAMPEHTGTGGTGTGGTGGTGGTAGTGGTGGVDTDAPIDMGVSDTPVEACTPEQSDAGCYSACAPNTDLGFLNTCATCAFSYDNGPLDLPTDGTLPPLP